MFARNQRDSISLPVEAHLAVIDCMTLCRWRLRRRLCVARDDVIDVVWWTCSSSSSPSSLDDASLRGNSAPVCAPTLCLTACGRELLSWRRLSQQLRLRAPGVHSAQSKITASRVHWHSWRFHCDSAIVNVCIYAYLPCGHRIMHRTVYVCPSYHMSVPISLMSMSTRVLQVLMRCVGECSRAHYKIVLLTYLLTWSTSPSASFLCRRQAMVHDTTADNMLQ